MLLVRAPRSATTPRESARCSLAIPAIAISAIAALGLGCRVVGEIGEAPGEAGDPGRARIVGNHAAWAQMSATSGGGEAAGGHGGHGEIDAYGSFIGLGS